MARLLPSGTLIHEDNCLADLAGKRRRATHRSDRRPALTAENLAELIRLACEHAPDGCNGCFAYGSKCCLERTSCRYHAYWKALEEAKKDHIFKE